MHLVAERIYLAGSNLLCQAFNDLFINITVYQNQIQAYIFPTPQPKLFLSNQNPNSTLDITQEVYKLQTFPSFHISPPSRRINHFLLTLQMASNLSSTRLEPPTYQLWWMCTYYLLEKS